MATTQDSVLCDLAEQVAEVAASAEHERRRGQCAAMHRLERGVTVVNAAIHAGVWDLCLGEATGLREERGLARDLECQLRFKLWKAAVIPDDIPVTPYVTLSAPGAPGAGPLWGVEPETRRTSQARGAYKPTPIIGDEGDLGALRYPTFSVDDAAKEQLAEEATALLGGRLELRFASDAVGCGPFEVAVRFRGMDQLLFDVYDRPELVHRLMDFFTEGAIHYHRSREAAGVVDATMYDWHSVYDELPAGLSPTRLASAWAYVHAQSAASFGPEMYAEFIQPYNARLAALFRRVYYHGCEDLSRKAAIIKDLPNLALFHVSPWTPPAPVVAILGDAVAYEVHSHPTRVFFDEAWPEVERDLHERQAALQGLPHTLTICDVETFNGKPEAAVRWAELAQEAARG